MAMVIACFIKRLEEGRFEVPAAGESLSVTLNATELAMMLGASSWPVRDAANAISGRREHHEIFFAGP